MGSSDGGNIPETAGRGNLGPYTNSLINAPAQGPDQAALAAYQAMFGGQPSYQQMANAHAMELINKLPLQSGKYLVSPTAVQQQQQPATPSPVTPVTPKPSDTTTRGRPLKGGYTVGSGYHSQQSNQG